MNEDLYDDPFLDEEYEEYSRSSKIDWAAYVRKFLSHKRFILIVTFIFGLLGCGYALMHKHLWRVVVTLAPEVQSSIRTSSSLKSITSLLGVGNATLANSTDALNITLSSEICASTPFLVQLFDVEIDPKISKKQLEKGAKPGPMTVYTYFTRKYMPEEEKSGFSLWMEHFFKKDVEESEELVDTINISYLTKEQAGVVKILRGCIKVNVDNKSGVTSISVTTTDPKVSTQLADTVSRHLQDYISEYRTKKAMQDYKYYQKMSEEAKEKMIQAQTAYAHSIDYDRSVILQSVSSEKERLQQEASLAQQMYAQMKVQEDAYKAKVQELRPVFAIIQPAQMPLRPADSRKKVALAFMFFGFVLATAWKVFLKDAISDFREKLKAEGGETNAVPAVESDVKAEIQEKME